MTTSAELTAALQAARGEMEAALAGLSPEQLGAPGAAGDWSAKDLLSHLIAWEAELVTGLAKFRNGQKPGKTDYTEAEIQTLNAQWHAESQGRPVARVLADFHGVRKQLLRQLEALPAKDLDAPQPWLKQKSIAHWVTSWIVEHEHEHAGHLQAWRRQAGI